MLSGTAALKHSTFADILFVKYYPALEQTLLHGVSHEKFSNKCPSADEVWGVLSNSQHTCVSFWYWWATVTSYHQAGRMLVWLSLGVHRRPGCKYHRPPEETRLKSPLHWNDGYLTQNGMYDCLIAKLSSTLVPAHVGSRLMTRAITNISASSLHIYILPPVR